jgi:nucleotide-binding universal stress UspA family protein
VIRRLLVAMDGSPHGEAAAALAIDWAGRFHAALLGLGILDKPSITKPEPVSFGGTAFERHRDEARLAHAHRQVLELLAAFHRRCEAAQVPCTLIEDIGSPHEQIVAEASGCDLVVLGRETHFQFETQEGPRPHTGPRDSRESSARRRRTPRSRAGRRRARGVGTVGKSPGPSRHSRCSASPATSPCVSSPSTTTALGPRRDSRRPASFSPPTVCASLSSRSYPKPHRPPVSWMRSAASGHACSSWGRTATMRSVISSPHR